MSRVLLLTCLLIIASCAPDGGKRKGALVETVVSPEIVRLNADVEHVSASLANIFAGIINNIQLYPDRNAVEDYAKAFGWSESPQEVNEIFNAKKGYSGKIAGKKAMLGSDGSNEIFSIAVGADFDRGKLLVYLRDIFSMRIVDSYQIIGQKIEVYKLSDGNADFGYVILNYGIAETIQGTGSLGYISIGRAKKEGLID